MILTRFSSSYDIGSGLFRFKVYTRLQSQRVIGVLLNSGKSCTTPLLCFDDLFYHHHYQNIINNNGGDFEYNVTITSR